MPSFERRRNHLKKVVDKGIKLLKQQSDICEWTLDEFVSEICWQASDNWIELNMSDTNDTTLTIHTWIGEHFYDYIKKNFNHIMYVKNC